MNYGQRFMTLYRRQGSRPSPWKSTQDPPKYFIILFWVKFTYKKHAQILSVLTINRFSVLTNVYTCVTKTSVNITTPQKVLSCSFPIIPTTTTKDNHYFKSFLLLISSTYSRILYKWNHSMYCCIWLLLFSIIFLRLIHILVYFIPFIAE